MNSLMLLGVDKIILTSVERELALCTFKPKISPPPHLGKRLYFERRRQLRCAPQTSEERELQQFCTFKPKINANVSPRPTACPPSPRSVIPTREERELACCTFKPQTNARRTSPPKQTPPSVVCSTATNVADEARPASAEAAPPPDPWSAHYWTSTREWPVEHTLMDIGDDDDASQGAMLTMDGTQLLGVDEAPPASTAEQAAPGQWSAQYWTSTREWPVEFTLLDVALDS